MKDKCKQERWAARVQHRPTTLFVLLRLPSPQLYSKLRTNSNGESVFQSHLRTLSSSFWNNPLCSRTSPCINGKQATRWEHSHMIFRQFSAASWQHHENSHLRQSYAKMEVGGHTRFPPQPARTDPSSAWLDEASILSTRRHSSEPKSDTSIGIGSRTTMRDQQQKPTKFTTTDATGTRVRITREYKDFPAPRSTPTHGRGGYGNLDARSLGASRPPGQRLELSPAARARIQANARSRGAAAAGAGRLLRFGGRGEGRGGGAGGRGGNRARRRSEQDVDAENDEDLAEIEANVEAHMAPPPREWVDHTPEDLSLEDLRVDWPTIPTGKVGMATGVEEKLRWMARKMQHGYDPPQELAHRLHKGHGLVHFESADEKEEVLKIAQQLADKSASNRTERTGEEALPKVVNFASISQKERAVLRAELIQGTYPPLEAVKRSGEKEKGRKNPAFLDEVVRILGNNETYHEREKGQLYETIQKLLPAQRRAGAGPGAGPWSWWWGGFSPCRTLYQLGSDSYRRQGFSHVMCALSDLTRFWIWIHFFIHPSIHSVCN